MRRIALSMFAVAVVAAGVVGLTSCSTKTEASVAEIKLPTIQCGSCVKTITKALEKADGVQKVDVNLEGKLATVTFASAQTDVKKLEQTIAKAGYAANETKADKTAYDRLASCCKVSGGGH